MFSVAEAENLAQPETTDIRAELIAKYPAIRCFAGAFLDVFEFRGGGAVSNLLKALALISEMYRAGKRTLPLKPPTAFIRRARLPFVFKDGDIDRRPYELCVFSELRPLTPLEHHAKQFPKVFLRDQIVFLVPLSKHGFRMPTNGNA